MSDKNPAVPAAGQSILVGVAGISKDWEHFEDTSQGRDTALSWLQVAPTRRLFRVYFDNVTELVVVPPVPARLREVAPEHG